MRGPRRGRLAAAVCATLAVSAWSAVAPGAAAAAGVRGPRSHVLIGVTPDQAYSVAVEGEEIPASPARSDTNGVLTFEFDDSSYPEGPLAVFVGPEGVFLVSGISVEAVTQTSARITWVTNALGTTRVEYGTTPEYGSGAVSDSAMVWQHMVDLTDLVPGTPYHFRVVSVNAGSEVAASTDRTFHTAYPPLEIGNVVVAYVSATTATIEWETNRPADSRVEYGETEAYGYETVPDPGPVASHSVTVTGLSPGTTYHFRAASFDPYGSAVSPDGVFETDPEPLAMTPPEVEDVGTSWAVISWTTSRPATSDIAYGLTEDYGDTADVAETLVADHSHTLSGLAEGTLYHFAVTSVDGQGLSVTSSDTTFETLDPGAMGPPALENVAATPLSATSISVSWRTDKPATSQVLYGCGVLDCATTADSTLTIDHRVVVAQLLPGREYCFLAVSACGDYVGESEAGTFTIELPEGQEPEGKPVTIVRSGAWLVEETAATIRWVVDRACSTWVEYGTDGYPSSRAGLSTGACGYEAVIEDLTPATLYRYRICAWHEHGGEVVGGEGVFETPAHNDGIAPAAPSGLECVSVEGVVEGVWEPNDEPDLAGYLVYRIRLEDGSPDAAAGTDDPDGRLSRINDTPLTEPSFIDADVEPGAWYGYEVVAVDECGNESESSERAVVHVDLPDPARPPLSLYPNPFVSRATVGFAVPPDGARVVARIYSAAGRVVSTVADGHFGAGSHEVFWDGRDASGRTAPSGVYFCELSVDGRVARERLTLIR